jgi:hypothetical protein
LLITAGLQVPVILLADVDGKTGTEPPAHIANDEPKSNIGATLGFTVTAKVVETAHGPASGVKVYVAEF